MKQRGRIRGVRPLAPRSERGARRALSAPLEEEVEAHPGRVTRRERVADDELSGLAALLCAGAAGVPGMLAAGPVGALLGLAAAASVFGYVEVRRWVHRDGAGTLHLRRQIRALGPPRPIGDAGPGPRRVRGRVKILEPVQLAGRPSAGWWSRRIAVERRYDGLSRSGRPVHVFEERQACGRIAVIDDTGAAVVAGERATLWCESPFGVFGPRGGLVRLEEGDPVEVVGEARLARTPDARKLLPAGYRDAGRCLSFDHTPVVVLLAPRLEAL